MSLFIKNDQKKEKNRKNKQTNNKITKTETLFNEKGEKNSDTMKFLKQNQYIRDPTDYVEQKEISKNSRSKKSEFTEKIENYLGPPQKSIFVQESSNELKFGEIC